MIPEPVAAEIDVHFCDCAVHDLARHKPEVLAEHLSDIEALIAELETLRQRATAAGRIA